MNYLEWSAGKPSLFQTIQGIMQSEFIDELSTIRLDTLYKVLHGAKVLPSSISSLSMEEVAGLIVLSYENEWSELQKFLKNGLILGKNKEIIIEENQKDDTIRVSSNDNINSVSAFNDDDVSVNDSTQNDTSEDVKRDYTKTSTHTEHDFDIVSKQLELMKTTLSKKMCDDISNILALSIY